MEVILLDVVPNLGEKNDIVNVRPGYANNYLIPQKLAILATPANRKTVAENLRQAQHRYQTIKDQALSTAEMLKGLTLRLPALAGKEGKLFGSVTTLQIANLLKEKGFDIDRKRISLDEEIKMLGSYTAMIHLHKEVKAELKFEVVEKNELNA